ncbi:Cas1p-domain-containing protein [Annulohypoxylon bovei var. microspora]|nr:Cas1p-domain-containing protein [Annulohypoxylon bovei var. microspora]
MFMKPWVRLTTAFSLLLVYILQQSHQDKIGRYDPYRCRALLHDGSWSPLTSDGSKKWEPKDCRMVEYPSSALHACLDGRKVVFVGDSTIRQVFWAAAERLEPGQVRVEIGNTSNSGPNHQDVAFETEGLKLEFIWDPWLNSTKLENILKSFHAQPTPRKQRTTKRKDDISPALILLSAPGLWAARYGGDDYLDIFKRGIDRITPFISDRLEGNMPLDLIFGPDDIANQILLAPVQVPEYQNLSSSRFQTITPPRIREMNEYLSQLSWNQSSHIPWAYNRLSVGSGNDFAVDGLHVSDSVAAHKLDVAINARCNTLRSRSRSFKGTCCVPIQMNLMFGLLRLVVVLVGIASLPLEMFLRVPMHEHTILNAAKAIVFTLFSCFYYDMTTFIGKSERHYQPAMFVAMCLSWLVVSIFSMRKNPQPTELPDGSARGLKEERNPEQQGYHDPGYLSRDHSNEIKGLMQGFILLYHYHYASQSLWVYKIIRLFISGYFYLTAYGHTLYLLKTNDFSFNRVMVVLFRLNILSALLPYVMQTDYTLYYFSPVITFWYLVLYGMLRIFRRCNNNMRWLIAKVILTAMVTVNLISSHGVLESAARASHVLFNVNWDAREMRFRLLLDRYIIFVGTVVAAFVHNASVRGSGPIIPFNNARSFFSSNRRRVLHLLCAVSLIVFFGATQTTLHQKVNYNKVHPFISWIPILSFVVLRNSLPGIRDVYLTLPAALGRISLETYVLQYHVWLGGSATAKHTFGLWDDF